MSFRKPYTMKRISSGRYENGVFIRDEAAPVETIIHASLQEATASVLQSLPEGRRNNETYLLISNDDLRVDDVSRHTLADVVIIGGVDFEVVKKMDWSNNIINHYEYIVSKKVQ